MKSFDIGLEVAAIHHEKGNSSAVLANERMRFSVSIEDEQAESLALGDALFIVSYDRRIPRMGDSRSKAGVYEVFDGSKWGEMKKITLAVQQ